MHAFSAPNSPIDLTTQLGTLVSTEFAAAGVARNHHDCGVATALRQKAGLSVASAPGQDEAVSV
jgi:hypothetical protein